MIYYFYIIKSGELILMIQNLDIEISNFFQLVTKITCANSSLFFAYYLYRNNELVEKTNYIKENNYTFNLNDPGNYHVRVYAKNKQGDRTVTNTDKVSFNGFRDNGVTNSTKPVLIYGVSRLSAAVKFILEEKYNVIGFITENEKQINNTFFDLDILNFNSISNIQDFKVVIVDDFNDFKKDKMDKQGIDYDIFKYNFFPNNIVLETIYNFSAYKLYEISRKCYLNGLLNGANFIKNFIHYKFNSYIPYTVDISDSVSFGYAGIGIVINGKSKIGRNVSIGQNVTIGSRGVIPEIGDNVWIGPGAKLIGGKIGNNVVIGANSVVTKEIPDHCVVAGVPAKIISRDIEKYESYFMKK